MAALILVCFCLQITLAQHGSSFHYYPLYWCEKYYSVRQCMQTPYDSNLLYNLLFPPSSSNKTLSVNSIWIENVNIVLLCIHSENVLCLYFLFVFTSLHSTLEQRLGCNKIFLTIYVYAYVNGICHSYEKSVLKMSFNL